jgi:hypothetical protein
MTQITQAAAGDHRPRLSSFVRQTAAACGSLSRCAICDGS